MSRVCDEPGCPLVTDGRCLEGHPDGVGCPHVREVEADSSTVEGGNAANEQQPRTSTGSNETTGPDEDSGKIVAETVPAPIELGGDLAMSDAESEPVAARYGARVVLVCGPFASGKTSLVAGLYGLFLDGPTRGWSFAGSASLMAIDGRFHAKRAATGLTEPDQAGTRDEDMRLLDLRLAKAGRHVNLMFSDVRGEYFEDVAAGRPVAEAMPLASRADLVAFVLNGEDVNDLARRAGAIHFMEVLIGGMTEPRGLEPGTPLAVVLSKGDLVDETGEAWFEHHAAELIAFAQSRGLGEAQKFVTAAFPRASAPEQTGLEGLLDWVTERAPTLASASQSEPAELRTFLRRGADV